MASGPEMYRLHSRKPRASMGMVSAWVATSSARAEVKAISSARVETEGRRGESYHGRSVDSEWT